VPQAANVWVSNRRAKGYSSRDRRRYRDRIAQSVIRTPDQRLRVFVSSALHELADERASARRAIKNLRLAPVLFEHGARPHPPRELYQAYLAQSHIFIGIYWQRYGWAAPGMEISGLEDEYLLSADKPRLIYVKGPASERESRLDDLLERIKDDETVSYKLFSTAEELQELVENDLALLLTERFEAVPVPGSAAVERLKHNLPAPPTPFVGHEKDIEQVRDLLAREDIRLVTLTGPAGVGKSRFGLEVARRLRDHFPDGVFLVELSAVRDPSAVPSAIARTLGIREEGDRPLIVLLENALRERKLTLLLDNFEHLLKAASLVTDLLAASPELRVLVTSQEPLHVRGEHEFPVAPLLLPYAQRSVSLEQLSDVEAVRLFVDRAAAVRPGFTITADNAPAVVEICHRLDGLPLAIELAAARVKLFPPQELLRRLESRLELLTGGPRDLPARQQSLRGALDWSYSLLDTDEQALFARLGVFASGAELDAIQDVCGWDLHLDVVDGVAALVDKSLLRPVGSDGDELRLGMLATITEYAKGRLAEAGAADATQERHARYYLRLAERPRTDMTAWLARLEVEHDNLRAALRWSLQGGDVELAARLAGEIWPFWSERSYLSEGSSFLEDILALKPDQMGEDVTRIWATVAHGAGVIAIKNDNARARSWLQESLDLYRQGHDRMGEAMTLATLATVVQGEGDYDEATASYHESLKMLEELDEGGGTAWILGNLGALAHTHGDDARAEELLEKSIALHRKLGDTAGTAWSLFRLGNLAVGKGDLDRARGLFEEALALHRGLNDKLGIVTSLTALAGVAHGQDDLERAARLLGAASSLHELIDVPLALLEHVSYEQTVSAVRADVGGEAFDTQWQRTRSLTLDEAIAAATEEV
jgi:predicted ATPase